jgi:hypothetical protein
MSSSSLLTDLSIVDWDLKVSAAFKAAVMWVALLL